MQRQISAVLEIDNALYCKIARGEQIPLIAEISRADPKELLILWLADQVTETMIDDKELSNKVLDIVKKNMIPEKHKKYE